MIDMYSSHVVNQKGTGMHMSCIYSLYIWMAKKGGEGERRQGGTPALTGGIIRAWLLCNEMPD